MGNFFRSPSTVSEASLIVTPILYIVIIASFIPSIVVTASIFVILIKIALTLLILVGIFGFINTLFIKDQHKIKQKLLFLLLHFVSLCAVSFGIYAYVIFKHFEFVS